MPTLDMVVTDAGRAEIIAADGTNPVIITEMAVGDSGYTPVATQTALGNEIKRITTVSGVVAAADDTISLSITDGSGDTYTMREFGLFSDAGTLIAVYSQTDPIVVKSASSTMALAADIILEALDVTSITFGDTNFLFPAATTDQSGVVELATLPESRAGADPARVLTAQGGQALIGRYGLGAAGYDSDQVISGAKNFSDPLIYQKNGYYAIAGTWQDGPDGVSTYVGTLHNIYSGADGLSSVIQYLYANGAQYVRTASISSGVPTFGAWFINYNSSDFTINQEIPAGIPMPWPLDTPPAGWLLYNGAAFSTSSFPFTAIAYPSGFLPDIRGAFIRGLDNGRGLDPGRVLLSFQSNAVGAHNHASPKTQQGNSGNQSPFGTTGGSRSLYSGHPAGGTVGTFDLTSTTGAADTRPDNVAFNFIGRAR